MKNDIQSIKSEAVAQILEAKNISELEDIRISYLGKSGKIASFTKNIKNLPPEEKKQVGVIINETKNTLLKLIAERKNALSTSTREWFDPTVPGRKPPVGHLHIVTQAIKQISEIFENIGFVRVRYPEVEWDWFAFEALNMPQDHPARDDWETFIVDQKPNDKLGRVVLTPHTSSGEVREMFRVKTPPIRMINISKCYRRQSDVSHVPMFHQFEGLVIDKNISIANLKGTLDYFVKNFFGEDRKIRLRPYNFCFTEPSFEVDISCAVCGGRGCKLCKEGWLELGGAGMTHPNVLKNGGLDPKKYTGFAFGWGVERAFMMKNDINIPDIRILYSTDLNYLKQF